MAEDIADLTGRVAVVIGGTSGLGRAIAMGLARSGAKTVPAGRRGPLVHEVSAEIGREGGDAFEHTVDVADRTSIDAVRGHFGRVDLLVNAAGRTARRPTVDVSEGEWASIMDTNLTGMLRACRSFHGPLKESGRGRINNIASLSSFVLAADAAPFITGQMIGVDGGMLASGVNS